MTLRHRKLYIPLIVAVFLTACAFSQTTTENTYKTLAVFSETAVLSARVVDDLYVNGAISKEDWIKAKDMYIKCYISYNVAVDALKAYEVARQAGISESEFTDNLTKAVDALEAVLASFIKYTDTL